MQVCDIYIIDFDDSFSYNIVSTLNQLGVKSKLVNYTKIVEKKGFYSNCIFILGPGPGHPADYQEYLHSFLEKNFSLNNNFFLGICLGHQIILSWLGYGLSKRSKPIHGQSREITIPCWREYFPSSYFGKRYYVQEYNSLCVVRNKNICKMVNNLYVSEGEILMAESRDFISYQFHPESVGTDDSLVFFNFIVRRYS